MYDYLSASKFSFDVFVKGFFKKRTMCRRNQMDGTKACPYYISSAWRRWPTQQPPGLQL